MVTDRKKQRKIKIKRIDEADEVYGTFVNGFSVLTVMVLIINSRCKDDDSNQ